MPVIGFHNSHEQVHPAELLKAVRHAEEVGFTGAMSSDHFSPWSERQGQSGFGWSFLGAALATTSLPFGAVNAPGPAVPPGDRRPGDRDARRDVPRAGSGWRWAAARRPTSTSPGRAGRARSCATPGCASASTSSARCWPARRSATTAWSHVDRARIWTLPEVQPALVCPAVSVATARTGAEWADGLVTVNQPHDKLREMIAAYRDAGGRGKLALQVHLSWDPDPDRATEIAYDQWRSNVFAPPVCWDLDHVEAFDAASEHVTPRGRREGRSTSRRTSASTPPGSPSTPSWASTRSTCTTSARSSTPSSTRSASTCCRSWASRRPTAGGGGMRITDTSDLWWKTAVVYCLDVETFMDWNGDGIGDFAGLAQRIDHLADLGVTCLWLMPFYPTAERDDGYDITDFYGVDPRLGTHGDLVEVIRTANDRGMRVIADLVVNHTSRKHPWFRAAEASKDSPFRDFYVWRSDPPPDTKKDVVFPDQETSIWTKSEPTGEWYLHKFYKEQPDLNVTNPRVRDEIAKVMGFWLQVGLSGFRVDAVPFFLETAGADDGALPDPHEYLRDLRALVGRRSGNGVLLGEVNLPLRAAAGVLRRHRRRRADHAVRLHRHAGDVPVAGPRGRRPAGRTP